MPSCSPTLRCSIRIHGACKLLVKTLAVKSRFEITNFACSMCSTFCVKYSVTFEYAAFARKRSWVLDEFLAFLFLRLKLWIPGPCHTGHISPPYIKPPDYTNVGLLSTRPPVMLIPYSTVKWVLGLAPRMVSQWGPESVTQSVATLPLRCVLCRYHTHQKRKLASRRPPLRWRRWQDFGTINTIPHSLYY